MHPYNSLNHDQCQRCNKDAIMALLTVW